MFRIYDSSKQQQISSIINRSTKTHANIMALARRDFLRCGKHMLQHQVVCKLFIPHHRPASEGSQEGQKEPWSPHRSR